ncbi:hypothetical protein DC083_09170 [Ignatzschineria ureiclastica]|uniref:Uncharacterized protein n=2 Tax=Ignatzschineria TaxID=112008 RepID=A0A2U2ACT3_9GAMM|nr:MULTISPECIES: hypothetical protein [Ignatzschineria]PWD80470.1 hypothetical protein DC083_09170 [Ignatzschineria ureiclastica]GGZ99244.1 hypothetical protein GCM10007162_14200 [Ignatzschineria ureiclastica]
MTKTKGDIVKENITHAAEKLGNVAAKLTDETILKSHEAKRALDDQIATLKEKRDALADNADEARSSLNEQIEALKAKAKELSQLANDKIQKM